MGSVTALTDAKGKVVQEYEYDSFGNLKNQKNRIKQPYTFTGREYDRETGLYYYRARYYDPVIGRFISKDPIGFAGGGVSCGSRPTVDFFLYVNAITKPYEYVLNNPINFNDPMGLCPAELSVGSEDGDGVTIGPNRATGDMQRAVKGKTIGYLTSSSGKCCGDEERDCEYLLYKIRYERTRDYNRKTRTYGSWSGWTNNGYNFIGRVSLKYSCKDKKFTGGNYYSYQ